MKIVHGLPRILAMFAAALLATGCANTGFRTTDGAALSDQGLKNMILRPKYPGDMAMIIPAITKEKFEAAFLEITDLKVQVVGNEAGAKPEKPFYYLNTEVTKYKPGSPSARWLMTPVIAFGLWGSYVNVEFSVVDPSTDAALGKGVIRKANLWGGELGKKITSETQLEACPKEIMRNLNSAVK